MVKLKNILMGFIVSFLGSIPLGYLNLVGLEIYKNLGTTNLVYYLLGVILIEGLVVYYSLIFANKLATNQKLIKAIDIFGVFFLLVLAYSFYSQSEQTAGNPNAISKYAAYSPFVIGILLSSINFLQIPFWTGWNLYLINGKYISTERKLKFFYVLGAVVGTFLGMITLVFLLNLFYLNSSTFSTYFIPIVIPAFFVLLACLQVYKIFKKYF